MIGCVRNQRSDAAGTADRIRPEYAREAGAGHSSDQRRAPECPLAASALAAPMRFSTISSICTLPAHGAQPLQWPCDAARRWCTTPRRAPHLSSDARSPGNALRSAFAPVRKRCKMKTNPFSALLWVSMLSAALGASCGLTASTFKEGGAGGSGGANAIAGSPGTVAAGTGGLDGYAGAGGLGGAPGGSSGSGPIGGTGGTGGLGGSNGVVCAPVPAVFCNEAPPDCTNWGYVPWIDGACWGAGCVLVDTCQCESTEDCPKQEYQGHVEQFVCWAKHRCGPVI